MSEVEVILVDIGNTHIKTVEVIENTFVNTKKWNDFSELDCYYAQNIPFMISSVRKMDFYTPRPHLILSANIRLPITLNYHPPNTLGTDRIAAAVGAYEIFPSENSLIIDLGTCMTVDVVKKNGTFCAGVISPGFKMRMKAMSQFTDNLPNVSTDWQNVSKNITSSTKACISNGAFWGMVHEINGYLSYFKNIYPSLRVIITGGDTPIFEEQINKPIQPDLKILKKGLYRIWKTNHLSFKP